MCVTIVSILSFLPLLHMFNVIDSQANCLT